MGLESLRVRPLLMSAGADNSLKQWVFDAADGAARLLKFRSGHAAPPTVVRHYGANRGAGVRDGSQQHCRAVRCLQCGDLPGSHRICLSSSLSAGI